MSTVVCNGTLSVFDINNVLLDSFGKSLTVMEFM